MILCSVIGCPLEHKAKAICEKLESDRCVAYLEVHESCKLCSRLRHWERLEDGTARRMKMDLKSEAA